MENLKFRYVFKHKIFNDISMYYFTIKDIENGKVAKVLKSGMIENGYELIARDLYIGYKDINRKEIYENDIVVVDDREIGAKDISKGEIYWCLDYTLESNPCFAGWSERGHFQLSPNIKIIGNVHENKVRMDK